MSILQIDVLPLHHLGLTQRRNGGGGRIRTRIVQLDRLTLYQLSYSRLSLYQLSYLSFSRR
ncbi:hypothetical protein M569_04744 [Genlisea aurea]|uniref:Uncharacterized protein n=1 Tax=Genlisea aurea TaxID=192259 RepID=S8CS08_9LAMI|nr:hypothetical protein M569_04744 [Genlisea aurea]